MLNLNLKNCFKVASTHGFSEKSFERFCEGKNSLLEKIFALKNKAGYAFLTLPDDKKNLKNLQTYLKQQSKNHWKHVVVLGIGGSALGAITVWEALKKQDTDSPQLHVLDNIDPTFLADFLVHL